MSKRKDKKHFKTLKKAAWERAGGRCERCESRLSKTDRRLAKTDMQVETPSLDEVVYLCGSCFRAERPTTAQPSSARVRRPAESHLRRLWGLEPTAPGPDTSTRRGVCPRCRSPKKWATDRHCGPCHDLLRRQAAAAKIALSKKAAKIDRRWNARTSHRQHTLEEIVIRQQSRTEPGKTVE
jgi:hypothetical protein